MAWTIKLTNTSKKQISKLDKQIAKRLFVFLKKRIALLDDPRSVGEALKGTYLGEYWKYRVGDYRIIAKIEDDVVTVLVLSVGHRKEVYR